jgi:hypothetical protein
MCEPGDRLPHEARADEKNQRECDLRDNERTARADPQATRAA